MIKKGISLILSLCVMLSGFGYVGVLSADAEEKNLALATNGATVTSSGARSGYDYTERVNDGVTDTSGWMSDNTNTDSYVQIKLAAPALISRIEFYTNSGNKANFALSYSLTGEDGSWANVTVPTSTTITANSIYSFSKSLSGVVAQYVRVAVPKNSYLWIREVEVYGELLNPYLSEIRVDGELLEGFDKNIPSYNVEVPSANELPTITATADDTNLPAENIVITPANSDTLKATIAVTVSGEGYEYTHIYTINMVPLTACADLSEISVDGVPLADFDRSKDEYTVYIQKSQFPEHSTVSATALSSEADVTYVQASAENMTATITVTPQGGEEKYYYVHFVLTDDNLALATNGATVTRSGGRTDDEVKFNTPGNVQDGVTDTSGWMSDNTIDTDSYVQIKLAAPALISRIDFYTHSGNKANFALSYSLTGEDDSWTSVTVPTSTTITANSIYSFSKSISGVVAQYVRVEVPVASYLWIREVEVYGELLNPYLSEIRVDGELLEGFNKNIPSYNVEVPSANELPTITATADDPNLPAENIVITPANSDTLKATIAVTVGGEGYDYEYTHTYTINMVSLAACADLKEITVGGIPIEDFNRNTKSYTVYIEEGEEIPTVSALPLVSGAIVGDAVTDSVAMTVKIPVTSADGNNTEEYIVNFVYTSDKLKSINVVPDSEFNENVTEYIVKVDDLTSLPQVSAQRKDGALNADDEPDVTITQADPTARKYQASIKVTSILGSTKIYYVYFEKNHGYNDLTDLENVKITTKNPVSSYPMKNAIDNNYATLAQAAKKDDDLPWTMVELPNISYIDNLAIYERMSSDRNEYFGDIQYSLTGEEGDWTDADTTLVKYTNKVLGSSEGRKRVYTFNGTVAAKYIRIATTTSGHINIMELEIYGKELNPYLNNIVLPEGYTLMPEFDSSITFYDVLVNSIQELSLEGDIVAQSSDSGATVAISGQDSAQVTIAVTTSGGEYTHPYTINKILKGSDTNLKSLTLSAGKLSPAFSRDVTDYTVYIEDSDEIPEVGGVALSDTTSVVPTQATAENMTASVLLTAQNGFQKTYTINFIRTSAALKSIKIDGQVIAEFDPNVRSYSIDVDDFDSFTFPEITAEALYGEDSDNVKVTQATAATKQAVIAVTSKLGSTKTYTVNFMERIAFSNLALNAQVKGSKGYTNTGAALAVDGAYNTMWQTNLTAVDYAQITITLPDIAEIDTIALWETFSASNEWWKNENITYSIDGENWSTILAEQTTYGNLQLGNYSTPGREHIYKLTEPTYARYVRFDSPKGGNFRLIEFEIYGELRTGTYLKNIELSHDELSGRFDPQVNIYDVFVASEDNLPTITATAEAEGITPVVVNATRETMKATVSVTNEGFTNVYSFNMIPRFFNTQLNALAIDSGDLIPKFSRDVTEYTVYLKPDDKFPTVSAEARSPQAIISYTYPDTDDENPQAVVRVTSGGDENVFTEYKINLVKTSADLKSLTVGAKPLTPAFSAEHYSYSVVLENGEALPTVSAETVYAVMSKEIKQPTEASMKATVTVKSYLNIERTYTINFYRRKNNPGSARLSYINFSDSKYYINEAFDPDKTEYTVYVDDRTSLPNVIPVTEDSGASFSVTPADPKGLTATITVTGSGGETKTYTVYYLINTALGKSAWESSRYNGTEGPKAIDGKFNTYWGASSGATPQWIICNLEDGAKIHSIVVHTRLSSEPEFYNVIMASDDGREWRPINVTHKLESLPGTFGYPQYYRFTFSFEPFDAKYVKVTGTGVRKTTILELELWGIPVPTVSANSYLKSLEFSNGMLTPAFSPYITNYTISLGKNDPLPTITAYETVNEFATPVITQATPSTMQAVVEVTAENGISKTLYTVNMDKEVDPEKNTYLSSLALSSGEISPAFSPKNSSYTVYLTPGAAIPDVTAIPQVSGATAVKSTAGNTMQITVTSQDTTASRIYTLNFVHVNADLSAISTPGAILKPALTPGVYTYTAEMAAGAVLPTVDATAAGDASVVITQPDEKTKKAIIVVKANGSDYTKKYTLNFTFRQSLEEAVAAALDAVKSCSVTNATTAGDIMSAVQSAVTNGDITLTWKTPFSKSEATTTSSGLISGVISLTLSGVSANVEVRKTLSKLSGGTPSGDGGSGGGGGGGGGGSSNVSFGTPTIDNDAVLDAAKQENTTDKYKEVRGHWAEKEVITLSEKGIVQGNGTSFALEDTVTRAEFITMLVRACDIELLPYNNAFTDVNSSDWFAQYIEAARRWGIASGYDGKFNPQGTASREEAVKMLVSTYELLQGEIAIENDIDFTDSEDISTWAMTYVQKAVGKSLVQGFETGEFMPKATLTRAQAMVLIYRLIGANEDTEKMR